MHLMLLGTSLALAGGFTSTTDSSTTTKSDYGFTSGEDKREECEKTLAGCVDDFTTDYGAYTRHLDGMIDDLRADTNIYCQMDIGHSLGGGIVATDDPFADIYTELLPTGEYVEHWYMQDENLFTDPFAPFWLQFEDGKSWNELENQLDASNDYPNMAYAEMTIKYTKLPEAIQTADLNYEGVQVERKGFEGEINGNTVANLLREIHYDANNNFVEQYDFWVFLKQEGDCQSFKLLDSPGIRLTLTPTDGTPTITPKQFYSWFQVAGNARGGAVIRYVQGVASDSPLYTP